MGNPQIQYPQVIQLNKPETCEFIENKFNKKERCIISRWGDGEYTILTHKHRSNTVDYEGSGHEKHCIAPDLLNALQYQNHFPCVAGIGSKKGLWYDVGQFYIKNSRHTFFGNANWNVYDYVSGSKLISNFFQGKTLIITGHHKECKKVFTDSRFRIIGTNKLNAWDSDKNLFSKVKNTLGNEDFDNIILSAGKASKILIPMLVPLCNSHLIDFGACINAVLAPHTSYDLVSSWGMSWAKLSRWGQPDKEKLERLSANFLIASKI
jgi:hypothetical protein